MKWKIGNEKWAIIFGGLTLILFSAKPYILDLIEPSKSLGQLIGENAKDLIDSMNGDSDKKSTNSRREIWSNIITISSFVLCVFAIFFSIITVQNGVNKWYGIGGGVLSIASLAIYISHLAIGLIGFMVVAILMLIIVTAGGS